MTRRDHVFTVSVRRVENADIVAACGELDLFSAPQLRDVLSNAGPCRARDLVLDLSSLRFLDSAGVGTIIAGRRLCVARGGRTVVVALQGSSVHKILHILGLHHVLEIAPSLELAMTSLDVDPARSRHDQQDQPG